MAAYAPQPHQPNIRDDTMTGQEGISYRLATIGDLESLVKLRTAFFVEATDTNPDTSQLKEALRHYFASALPNGEFMGYIALARGQAVATSGMVIHRHPPRPSSLNGYEAYVMNMYTTPPWRGRGIATALLARLIALATERGCHRILLHATDLGRPIYAKAGFVSAEGEMRLDLPRSK